MFAALAMLAACSAPAPPATRAPSPFAPSTHTILTAQEALALSHQCSRPSPGPVQAQWTPSEADIQTLEPNLATILRTHLDHTGEATPIRDYYRQYAGFVIGARRIIYINGIERSAVEATNPNHPFDWRTQAIGICDGGPITFGVEFDPASGEFTRFAFNGAI
jgi:hypothetical protein